MKRFTIALILLTVIGVVSAGCGVTGTGNTITEDRDFTEFTSVDVGGAFDVEITQSDSYSVTISGDEAFFDYIVVAKEGDTLKISLKPHHIFTDFTMGARTLKAEITMPALHGLEISGATKGTISGFKSTNDFDVEVSGASSLVMSDIEAGDATFDISGASKANGSITADNIDFEISGASSVKLTGTANNLKLDASGASTADLPDLPFAEDGDIDLSGASKATINVKGTVNCDISAASSLYFLGNPTMGDIEVSGASTIKHK